MGVVNFQKLLEEAPQTKTAMQALENEFAPRRRELLTMQNDLKAREEKLQKEGALMSEADRAKAEKTFRDEQREFSRKAGEFQDDGSTRRNEEIGKVQRYLVTEIQGYANAQGYRSGARRRRVFRQRSARHNGPGAGGARHETGDPAARAPGRRRSLRHRPRRLPASSSAPTFRTSLSGAQVQGDYSLGELAVRFGLGLRGEPDLRVSRGRHAVACRTRGIELPCESTLSPADAVHPCDRRVGGRGARGGLSGGRADRSEPLPGLRANCGSPAPAGAALRRAFIRARWWRPAPASRRRPPWDPSCVIEDDVEIGERVFVGPGLRRAARCADRRRLAAR